MTGEMRVAIIVAALSGSLLTSIVGLIHDIIMWRKKRKADKEDKADLNSEDRLKKLEATMQNIVAANKYIIYDRIRFIGQSYIKEGSVDFDDRRILVDMHDVYHNGLGGNGDLDNLMKQVNALPLKLK